MWNVPGRWFLQLRQWVLKMCASVPQPSHFASLYLNSVLAEIPIESAEVLLVDTPHTATADI